MRLASGEPAPAKRRSSGDRPVAHTLPPKTIAALSLGKQSSGSLTSDSAAIGRKRARSPSASGRPQRKVRCPPSFPLAATFGHRCSQRHVLRRHVSMSKSGCAGSSQGSIAHSRVCHHRRLAGGGGGHVPNQPCRKVPEPVSIGEATSPDPNFGCE